MKLDYEKLDVYHVAIDFVVASENIIEAFPRGRGIISMLTKMIKVFQ